MIAHAKRILDVNKFSFQRVCYPIKFYLDKKQHNCLDRNTLIDTRIATIDHRAAVTGESLLSCVYENIKLFVYSIYQAKKCTITMLRSSKILMCAKAFSPQGRFPQIKLVQQLTMFMYKYSCLCLSSALNPKSLFATYSVKTTKHLDNQIISRVSVVLS